MQGLKSVICSWEVALSWKAPAIAFLLLLQIIGFKMSPFWDSLAYTEANNQFLKKSFLGESGYHTGEESSAVCRQITGDFISCHSLYLLSFLPKTSITSPPQKTSLLRGVWDRIPFTAVILSLCKMAPFVHIAVSLQSNVKCTAKNLAHRMYKWQMYMKDRTQSLSPWAGWRGCKGATGLRPPIHRGPPI